MNSSSKSKVKIALSEAAIVLLVPDDTETIELYETYAFHNPL